MFFCCCCSPVFLTFLFVRVLFFRHLGVLVFLRVISTGRGGGGGWQKRYMGEAWRHRVGRLERLVSQSSSSPPFFFSSRSWASLWNALNLLVSFSRFSHFGAKTRFVCRSITDKGTVLRRETNALHENKWPIKRGRVEITSEK